MHLCLWADWGWEVLHHDGATGAGTARNRAPGTYLTGQPGQGRVHLLTEEKDRGLRVTGQRAGSLRLAVIENIMGLAKIWTRSLSVGKILPL